MRSKAKEDKYKIMADYWLKPSDIKTKIKVLKHKNQHFPTQLCYYRLVTPVPRDPLLHSFCYVSINTPDSDHQLIRGELHQLSVSDKRSIQNVQSGGSPGPGLKPLLETSPESAIHVNKH